jgi:hypothetical protein
VLMKNAHTFEGVDGDFEVDSASLVGCRLPFAESNGVDGVTGRAGVAGLAIERLAAGVLGVAGVCGGGPIWKLGMGTLERSLPFLP